MDPTGKTCAVILGYGIPRDIFMDGNYHTYLEEAHAYINREGITDIVFCGGHTNIHYPERSEAAEMQRLFEKIHDEHFATLQKELDKLLENTNGLSLDQILYMRRELERMQADFLSTPLHFTLIQTPITSFENIQGLNIFLMLQEFSHAIVFCEQSRQRKIQLLCRKIITERATTVIGIDFDQSRTWRKDAKQIADYFLTWMQILFPEIGNWRNARQRRHIENVSQK